MRPTDDSALLHQYAGNNSNDAFATLVTRHINLVYSVALRQVGNPHHAKEITQVVFIILAKKAGELRHRKTLSSWLFQTTRLTANNFVRSETRRRHREQEAYMQSNLNESGGEVWPEITPLLDTAVARLGEKDRHAILLRFYEGRNLSEVGAALGASEDAAKKRVNRAVEKLRGFFARRGVVLPAAILTAAISANSVQAAPPVLAKSVTAVALSHGAAAGGLTSTLMKGTLKIMAWTKAKIVIAAGGCVLLAIGTTAIAIYNQTKPIQGIPKNWSALSGNLEDWTWANGKINGHDTNGDSILASDKEYGDIAFSAVVTAVDREASLAFRMQDANNGYFAVFVSNNTAFPADNGAGRIDLVKRVDGNETVLATYHGRIFSSLGESAKMQVIARRDIIEIRLNDTRVLRVKDSTFAAGLIGFRMYGSSEYPCDATFSKVSF